MNKDEPKPQHYPDGIEYRTPRPRQISLGALALGGLLGYSITQNAAGAIAGGSFGALFPTPVELPQALQQHFTGIGFQFVRFYRLGRFGAKIIFKYNETFVALESRAPQEPEMSPEQIEDWLYGDLTEQQFEKFQRKFAHKFAR
jgi:hypothetical protein